VSRIPTLVDTIIRLKRTTQTDLSERSAVHPSNLSKFLSGESDMRSSSMISILENLGIDLEKILENEIESLIGKPKENGSVGEALEILISKSDPFTAKTILESLSSKVKPSKDKNLIQALETVKSYKQNIKSIRSHA
jgi:hypothetical protein